MLPFTIGSLVSAPVADSLMIADLSHAGLVIVFIAAAGMSMVGAIALLTAGAVTSTWQRSRLVRSSRAAPPLVRQASSALAVREREWHPDAPAARRARRGESHPAASIGVGCETWAVCLADLSQVELFSAPGITLKLDEDHVRIVQTFREPRLHPGIPEFFHLRGIVHHFARTGERDPRVARGQGDTGAGVDRELGYRCRVETVISPVNFETSSGLSVITASNVSS